MSKIKAEEHSFVLLNKRILVVKSEQAAPPTLLEDELSCTALLLRLAHCAALIGWRDNIKFRSDSFTHCCSASLAHCRRTARTVPGVREDLPNFPAFALRLPLKVSLFYSNMKERRLTQPFVGRCKLVLVGDVQCGKTAMLQVLVKDCYPEV